MHPSGQFQFIKVTMFLRSPGSVSHFVVGLQTTFLIFGCVGLNYFTFQFFTIRVTHMPFLLEQNSNAVFYFCIWHAKFPVEIGLPVFTWVFIGIRFGVPNNCTFVYFTCHRHHTIQIYFTVHHNGRRIVGTGSRTACT